MKVLLQRISEARVTVDEEVVAATARGLLLFVGAEKNDDQDQAVRLARRVLGYRVFPDEDGRMNHNVLDTGGELLVVPQFTLAADTRKGTRPGFSSAAPPEQGEHLYETFVAALREGGIAPATGRFGADMQVQLINDGPVTFLLES